MLKRIHITLDPETKAEIDGQNYPPHVRTFSAKASVLLHEALTARKRLAAKAMKAAE